MVTVKFFGLLNVDNDLKKLSISDGKLSDIIEEIITLYPTVTKKQLLQSVIFINKKQTSGKRSSTIKLKDNDEVVFISPTSGG